MAETKRTEQNGVAIPILCRFWFEDGVWNGTAEDMAVAVFGSTFEEAMSNMRAAVGSHIESVMEAGEIEDLIRHLQERAKEYGFLSLDELSPSSPLVKMLVAIRDREVIAVT